MNLLTMSLPPAPMERQLGCRPVFPNRSRLGVTRNRQSVRGDRQQMRTVSIPEFRKMTAMSLPRCHIRRRHRSVARRTSGKVLTIGRCRRVHVVSGLSHRQTEAFNDGGGDHSRASASWLSGVHPTRHCQVEARSSDCGTICCLRNGTRPQSLGVGRPVFRQLDNVPLDNTQKTTGTVRNS
jgi:hypothetical protein